MTWKNLVSEGIHVALITVDYSEDMLINFWIISVDEQTS